ncbi:hypothetical protein Tco_0221891 [Tanacetum coccineum]|uniref:Uncharacterized protein n=1 Tax=Tanacetum coccineum TaxID=301880 RepID=A0ABQ4XIN3_9ASTR
MESMIMSNSPVDDVKPRGRKSRWNVYMSDRIAQTCLNDVMYFPTYDVYGLSSNAGNMEKLTALQNEFDAVKKRMDDGTKKALRSEQKIKLLTNRYKMRAAKIWSQVE